MRLVRTPLAWLALAALSTCTVTAAATAQDAAPAPDARLAREVAVEVRAATVGDLTSRLATALGVRMEADPDVGAQRVTLYATKTSLLGLQQALGSLFRTRWAVGGEGAGATYRLGSNDALVTQADRLRQQIRSRFVARLLQTEEALRRRDADVVTEAVRADVGARVPYFSGATLDEISPGYLQQALLLQPVRLGLTGSLSRTGSAYLLFRNLSPRYQQLLSDFAIERYQSAAAAQTAATEDAPSRSPSDLGPLILNYPQARVEYRILHGDRWSGSLMVARVGASDHWATAVLPSILFDLPDYATLYPQTAGRTSDLETRQPVAVSVDTDTESWDEALTAVARAARINVVTDSYLRPEIFRPAGDGPVIRGTTLGDTLDQLAGYYGYAWWKQGDWYIFRSRLWAEEERVAFPDRLMQSMGRSLSSREGLASAEVAALAGLTEEQLLSMHLYGSAAGRPYAPPESFDLNEVQLARAGLTLFAQMNPQQRELVRGPGLPFPLMTPAQQSLFAAVAMERALPIEPYMREAWRFRISEQFRRERLPAGAAQIGALGIAFDFGQAGTARADLAVRVPGFDPPAPATPPAQ